MKRFYFTILYTLFLISLIGCQTVSKKIEDTTAKEEQKLSKWLNKPEKDLKSFYSEEYKEAEDKINEDGFFIPRNLINKEIKRVCPVCETYSFSGRDDLYMNKFECCYKCYIQLVEGREEKWLEGWRPDKEQD